MDKKAYTLFKRNGIWQLRIRKEINGKKIFIRQSLKTSDKHTAIEKADERTKEIIEETEFKTNRNKLRHFTLDEAFGFYYEEHGQYCVTGKKLLKSLAYIASYFDKDMPFEELTEEDISEFVSTRRKEGKENGTINRDIALISAVIKLCQKRRIASPDIYISSFKLKEKSENIKYIKSVSDLEKIINSARPYFQPVIKFAILSGFRLGTILNLKWENIEDGVITVFVKSVRYEGGKIYRKIIYPEMQELLDKQPKTSEYVFTKDGHQIRSYFYEWKYAMDNSGVPYINFHGLRHTHATWLLQKTGNLKLVSQSLGHANVMMTAKYAHLIKSEEGEIMQKVFAF